MVLLALTRPWPTFTMTAPLRVAERRGMSLSSRMVAAEACRAMAPGGRFRLRVSGGSMNPILRDGDEIEAERVADPRGVSLGDLVVIDLPDAGLVVHRVLWRSGSGLRTWGDGSRRMDPPIHASALVGRVVAARRGETDVTPSPLARRLQWGRHFTAAALHRLRRRLA